MSANNWIQLLMLVPDVILGIAVGWVMWTLVRAHREHRRRMRELGRIDHQFRKALWEQRHGNRETGWRLYWDAVRRLERYGRKMLEEEKRK